MDTNRQADVEAIEAILRRIEMAENTGNPSDIVGLLADDAVIMVPNQPVQEGREACAAFVTEVVTRAFSEFDRRIAYVSSEVRIIGDYAIDRGRFAFTVTAEGETSQETGKYLFLYSRGAAGPWQISRAIVNLDDHEEEEHGGLVH